MLCRTSKLAHPGSGISLETPLLIPSFSSKAFGFSHGGKPEVSRVLDATKVFITRTCLISAYDVHYEYVPDPQDLTITVDLMFLDSGGYEVSNVHDLSSVEKPVNRPDEWDAAKLRTTWDQWPDSLPAVLVSYDHPSHRKPVSEQIREAKQATLDNPNHLHSFLLKPETQEEWCLESALQALQAQVKDLAEFQLIGVTEKELGDSTFERMLRIANLRRVLDDAAMSIPIHVFGTLDPLSVCLYFAAGAEVFDGLTWFRYAYRSGQCVYIQNNANVVEDLEIDDDETRMRTIKNNLRYLDQLEGSLRLLARTGSWTHLIDNRNLVQSAAKKMMSRYGGLE